MRTQTSPSVLLVAAVAAGLLANLLVNVWYSTLPTLPVMSGVVVGLLGVGNVVLAEVLAARVRRRPGSRPVDALAGAQAVALAKASSLGGAVIAGAWTGLLAYLLPRRGEIAAVAADVPAAVTGVIGAAVLVGGGLWLEYRCRTPDPPRDVDPASAGPY